MAIQAFTDLDLYYGDEENFGNHQYVSLKDIVNNFIYSQGEDSYVKNVDVGRAVYHAKRVIQELYYDVLNEVISIELDLSTTFTVPLPHDFVSYIMISWVDSCGNIHPIGLDNRTNISQIYLQDNNYNYLFDGNGDILLANESGGLITRPDCAVTDPNLSDSGAVPLYTSGGPCFNTDLSKVFKNGTFKIDKVRGVIQFSTNLTGKTILIDYISDGLFQKDAADISVHKFAEDAVYQFIYHRLINNNRNVPEREKIRAEREWFNKRRVAKRRIQPIRLEEIRQVMKGSSKMIKG